MVDVGVRLKSVRVGWRPGLMISQRFFVAATYRALAGRRLARRRPVPAAPISVVRTCEKTSLRKKLLILAVNNKKWRLNFLGDSRYCMFP
ncbi:hypothetical protein ASD03_12710 [Ensifer sp. Root127]|nr:hypothetical protein ASD03_12710 [Ensifer sp. Root127]